MKWTIARCCLRGLTGLHLDPVDAHDAGAALDGLLAEEVAEAEVDADEIDDRALGGVEPSMLAQP